MSFATPLTLARTRAVYDLLDVQDALDRSRGRSPELDAFYERMLDTGPERFVTTPSSIDALSPLFEECPNFDEVLDDLARYLRLAHAGNKGFNVMPILLLGGPGVGKTHFAKRLARAMGTDCELISMNALSAGFVITGSSASWRGAKCGKVAERLVRGQYANPVVVLDEVEKATGSSQSDPLAALYQLLEPETARAFRDEFIDVEVDASQIFWVLTANSVEGIPAPLLNRMAVYEVPAPTPDQAAGIAQRMYASLLEELNLTGFDALLGDAVLDKLAPVSPRDLRKTLLDSLGYAVAGGRGHIMLEDVRLRGLPGRSRIGF
ncbi:AAA family ATPase [Massilia sp. Dwa41.01b]|uniref:AAA family ATPase n=1 Tax=unclassified Massilia TaxID=2609279 RepID=UPI001603F958|nr:MULTISPECIES: AAA family ATPase [unclassified Massilia]QNA88032.1 AAA family ATPase [Massilia sp. Dwa41.01b]QNA98936.1 AAA family ATPase [Massilia sp. Se16.2.3]